MGAQASQPRLCAHPPVIWSLVLIWVLLGADFADVMKASNHLTLQWGYCPGRCELSYDHPESGKSERIIARGISHVKNSPWLVLEAEGTTWHLADDQPGNEASVVQIEGTECCQPPE